MTKGNQPAKPPGRIARAVKVVADNLNLPAASRKIDEIVDEEAPRAKPKPADDGRAGKLQRLGARVGYIGIVAVTAAAVLAGAAGCNEDTPAPSGPAPSAHASCEEPASWCGIAAIVVVR